MSKPVRFTAVARLSIGRAVTRMPWTYAAVANLDCRFRSVWFAHTENARTTLVYGVSSGWRRPVYV
eukprot:4693189-Prymnesium_polylepis.1